MALVLKDRVKETTTSVGTGDISLAGAAGPYQAFSTLGNGNDTYYAIVGQTSTEWEVGIGTYVSSGNKLVRNSVYSSSNSNTLVNFSAGIKDVFCTYPSEQAVYQETDGSLKIISGVIEVSEDGTEGTTLPNTSFQAFVTGNFYMQANQQNLSSGANASSDWVVTADNGTDTTNFMDVGMASSGYNYPDYSATKANDGYVINTGNNLVFVSGKFGALTPGAQDIVFVAGSLKDTEERMRVKGDTGNVILNSTANPTDTGEKLQVVGTAKITGATTFGSTVTLNADPSANLQAATKQYVDNVAALGIIPHTAVRAEAIGNLNATYNNGTLGVGATLTNAGTQAALVLDGVTLNVNDRVIVMDQTTQTQNGVYTVTNVGSGSTNWILTRATDADTYGVANSNKLAQGSYFYIQEGDTAAGESYVCSTVGTITFGVTAITFSQFSASPAYTGTAPINVSGQTISLTGVVSATHGGTGLSAYTAGDLVYSNATNTLTNLAVGSTGQTLIVSGGAPVWGALNLAGVGVSGNLPESHGGTNQSSYATGDTLYASATNTLSKLSGNTTTTKQFLSQTGTGSVSQAPSWASLSASDIQSGVLGATNGGTGQSSYAVGDLLYADTTTSLAKLADVATGNVLTSGGVGAAPAWGKVALASAVSGTLGVTNGGTGTTTSTGSGNVVLSTSPTLVTPILGTPQSGNFSTGTFTWPTFNQNTTGTAGNVSGTVAIANGGTGATTQQAAINALAGATTSGYYLRGNGTNVVMAAISAGDVPTLNQNTTGTAAGLSATLAIASGGTGATSAAAALTSLGAYPATNPNGYTSNTGTVTSVAAGSYLTGGTITTSGTLAVDATTTNTASKVVARDASGNFAAGTITASLSGSATTFTSTTQNSQFNSVGVGTAGSGTAGEIRATNNVTAYYSDMRFKDKIGNIDNALAKVQTLDGFYYEANELAQSFGYEKKREVGVSAQQVQAIMPEVVAPAPIDENYLTVRYERLVPLLIEAIKELKAEIDLLKGK
jgi:hypothetical protein